MDKNNNEQSSIALKVMLCNLSCVPGVSCGVSDERLDAAIQINKPRDGLELELVPTTCPIPLQSGCDT